MHDHAFKAPSKPYQGKGDGPESGRAERRLREKRLAEEFAGLAVNRQIRRFIAPM